MGKKRTLINIKTGERFTIDEDSCYITTCDELIKSGGLGKQEQYKYFCEHPEEIEDEKLFSELEEEFGNANTEEIN